MTKVNRSALVMHTAEQMFELVNNVRRYPDFLPWCSSTEVIKETDGEMVARLNVAKAGLKYSFTTHNQLQRPQQIDIALVEGPFSSLKGRWLFTRLSDEACKVTLDLDFSFTGKLANMAMSKVFNQIAVAMVDAFCQQADVQFGG